MTVPRTVPAVTVPRTVHSRGPGPQNWPQPWTGPPELTKAVNWSQELDQSRGLGPKTGPKGRGHLVPPETKTKAVETWAPQNVSFGRITFLLGVPFSPWGWGLQFPWNGAGQTLLPCKFRSSGGKLGPNFHLRTGPPKKCGLKYNGATQFLNLEDTFFLGNPENPTPRSGPMGASKNLRVNF